jgi:hypothetical protein
VNEETRIAYADGRKYADQGSLATAGKMKLDISVFLRMRGLTAEEVAVKQGVPDCAVTTTGTRKGSFIQRHKISFRAKNRAEQASPDAVTAIDLAFAIDVRTWVS